MLEPVDRDIWIAEGGNVDFHGFAYPTRSVIARLTNGDLWVWSPIAFDPALAAALDAQGPVRHLVSPNKIHHLFLADWARAYSNATLWAPASTIRKRCDLVFAQPLTNLVPAAWAGEIDQVRFAGSPFMDEIVFFHRASRTAILADLSEHFSERFLQTHWSPWQRALARVWGIAAGMAPLLPRSRASAPRA